MMMMMMKSSSIPYLLMVAWTLLGSVDVVVDASQTIPSSSIHRSSSKRMIRQLGSPSDITEDYSSLLIWRRVRRIDLPQPVLSSLSSSSSSITNILSIHRGGGVVGDLVVLDTSKIIQIMKIHRFIAFGFGMVMIFIPTATTFGMTSLTGANDGKANLGAGEILALQSWGFFIVFVAYMIQTCIRMDVPNLTLSVAKGLCFMFVGETLLYIPQIAIHRSSKEGDREISIFYTSLFGLLALAYGWGIRHA